MGLAKSSRRLRRPLPKAASLASLLLAFAVLASACSSGTSYRYVKSASSGTYAFFKVPDDWTRYNKKQLLLAAHLDESGAAASGFSFLEAYDADPHPSIDHVFAVTTYPVVMAQVQHMEFQTRDQASLGWIRNSVFPVDQLLNNNQADILENKDLVLDGGVHGSLLRFDLTRSGNLTLAPDNEVIRVAQIGLFDPGVTSYYVIVISCTATCYDSNQAAIKQILDSYTVKEQ
jgi:hypothetical protein